MPYYRNIGNVPPKRHTQHRDKQGRLYYEELMGEEGFSSSSSLLYHRNHPSSIRAVREWELGNLETVPNHPLKPLHFKLHDLEFAPDADAAAADLANPPVPTEVLAELPAPVLLLRTAYCLLFNGILGDKHPALARVTFKHIPYDVRAR